MSRRELVVSGPDHIMDIIRQQPIQMFTLSQRFFRVFSFGNVPSNGHVQIFSVDGQTEGADFDREFVPSFLI